MSDEDLRNLILSLQAQLDTKRAEANQIKNEIDALNDCLAWRRR